MRGFFSSLRTLKGWLRLILVAAALCAVLFGLALGALCVAEAHPPAVSEESGAVIVLGCQVYADGSLSPQLELRLKETLKTYEALPRPIVVCGGQGENEPAPEGRVMRDWLVAHGVPADQVTAECASQNTRQNLQNARALLPGDIRRVTVITSDYHLPRALALCRDLDLDADGIGSPCLPEIRFWVKNHFREVLAWGKYLGEKMLGRQ